MARADPDANSDDLPAVSLGEESVAARTEFHAQHHLGASAFYYLHPPLAGPIDGWAAHFVGARDMGFAAIALGSPFAADTAEYPLLQPECQMLHPGLGGGRALDALGMLSERAAVYGLALVLDLSLAGFGRSTSPGDFPADDATLERWGEALDTWCRIGIAGFRCEAAHHVPAQVWMRLVTAVRRRHSDACFLAFTHGASPEAVTALASCGFDAAASSSCWWDFRAGWIDEDAARVEALGPLIALPEPLFGSRATAMGASPAEAERSSRRALCLAANYAPLWLMPMGFEFGAIVPLERDRGDPQAFAALAAHPAFDLRSEIAALNARRRAEPERFAGEAARLVSAPGAEIAVLVRGFRAAPRFALALNPDLARPASIPAASILPGLGGAGSALLASDTAAPIAAGGTLALDAGEAQILAFAPAPPIVRSLGVRDTPEQATRAPRIAIEAVSPAVEGGRFLTRRIVGEMARVEASLVSDGHTRLAADLLWRPADVSRWQRTPMVPLGNDRYAASFPLQRIGRHFFTIEAWRDVFASFTEEIGKKHAAGLPIALELEEGRALLDAAAKRPSPGAAELSRLCAQIAAADPQERLTLLTQPETTALMRVSAARDSLTRLDPVRPLDAERPAAGFASWYELFPRSQSGDPARHGTFADVIARLPAIRAMGFDVLYLPPIHPIGRIHRKGRNNAPQAGADDPGSPWAIGSIEGGHEAVHPALGTLGDFQRLREAAGQEGIEIALDFAVQCAPDHPWVREHPEWFDWRPDGSIRYAENPPKRYEDIVNVSFYGEGAVPSLWIALRDVVRFWLSHGVRTFRVDNPHTKPLPFWEWLIEDIRAREPDVIFLAEAFTRPSMMYRLAEIGFSQSYTYFTWRNTKEELTAYFTELTTPPLVDFFRPHLFVNTPDINPFFLQHSGRPGFLIRAALAATLSGLWGMYNGFELCEAAALPGREEYRDSEKYQIRAWDWDRPGNIRAEITRLNQIRRANPALHSHRGTEFLNAFDERVLYYMRTSPDRRNILLVAVNLDPGSVREAEIEIPLWHFGLPDHASIGAEDLMRQQRLVWHGKRQRIRLDPADLPFLICRLDQPSVSPP